MHKMLCIIALVILAALYIAVGCSGDDDKDEDDFVCTDPLRTLYDTCGFTATFDDVNPAEYDDAWDSCVTGRGKMWEELFICWDITDNCLDLADCLPEHGYFTSDDELPDDDDDDDVADDDDDDVSDDDDDDTDQG